MSARETERAALGQSQARRAGLAPRAELKQLHRSAFARDLAAHLREAALSQGLKALARVVSNPFPGELLSHLYASLQKIPLRVARAGSDLFEFDRSGPAFANRFSLVKFLKGLR